MTPLTSAQLTQQLARAHRRQQLVGALVLSAVCPLLAGAGWTLGVSLAHLVTR